MDGRMDGQTDRQTDRREVGKGRKEEAVVTMGIEREDGEKVQDQLA